MQGKDIRHLVAAVPSTVHFYNEPCGFDGAEVDYTHNLARGAHAANDPSFRWRYAACFSGAGLALPRLADGPMRNAYTFQICGYADDNLREAVAIHLNPSRLRQAFVQALLLLQELSMPEIAEAASLPLKALKYYEQLFFSVRDRMNDKAFIAGIVYPDSLRESQVLDGQDFPTLAFVGDFWRRCTAPSPQQCIPGYSTPPCFR